MLITNELWRRIEYDPRYEVFNADNSYKDYKYLIVVGECYWTYSEWYSYSEPRNLSHTRASFNNINKMLQGID